MVLFLYAMKTKLQNTNHYVFKPKEKGQLLTAFCQPAQPVDLTRHGYK